VNARARSPQRVTCPDCGAPLDVLLDVTARFELRRMADDALAIGALSDTAGQLRRLAVLYHGTDEGFRIDREAHADYDARGDFMAPSPKVICTGPDHHVYRADEL
jgi:hypothetical protein